METSKRMSTALDDYGMTGAVIIRKLRLTHPLIMCHT